MSTLREKRQALLLNGMDDAKLDAVEADLSRAYRRQDRADRPSRPRAKLCVILTIVGATITSVTLCTGDAGGANGALQQPCTCAGTCIHGRWKAPLSCPIC
jgi:hypothetical protein